MKKIANQSIIFAMIAALVLIPFGSAALAEEYFEAEEPEGGERRQERDGDHDADQRRRNAGNDGQRRGRARRLAGDVAGPDWGLRPGLPAQAARTHQAARRARQQQLHRAARRLRARDRHPRTLHDTERRRRDPAG